MAILGTTLPFLKRHRQGTPRGAPGARAYAIGDIHGRLDLLEELLVQIEAEIAASGANVIYLVFLGDLIDRGPDSAGVVERLRTYRPEGVQLVFVMGNHEEIFLKILNGETKLLRQWLRYGGAECLRSYGLAPETLLVLQAGCLASAGEVFVLDMGEPVKISDLAKTMLALSGMTERTADNPTGDIEIAYVGLRPGEKLCEELFIGEEIADTAHPQIKMARERSIPLEELQKTLSRLQDALAAVDAKAVRIILGSLISLDHRLAA